MSDISVERLHELYLDAVKRCTSDATALSDEEMEYNLFEEFDVGVQSFFHDDSLAKLFDAGLISETAMAVSQEIRNKWLDIRNTTWTTDEIRNNTQWRYIFVLCDQLVTLLPTTTNGLNKR